MSVLTDQKVRDIVILAPRYTSILDVAGPLDVFAKTPGYPAIFENANQKHYRVHVVSDGLPAEVPTSTGLPLLSEGPLSAVDYPVDTLLVTGIPGPPENMVSEETLSWIKRNWEKIRRVGSVCNGAFILAEAGVLDGRRATTHWARCERLSRLYPKVKVDPDPIFIKDGTVYTSAGISAGMDLALAMVEEDFGREVALNVARTLVLYLKRQGNQSQFSVLLFYQQIDYEPVKRLIEWIPGHLDEKLTVEVMAEQVSMSPRNFARVFASKTGITPAKFIEKLRLETARRRLEESNLTLEEISAECGTGSADTLRRMFLRHFKTTPADYRRSFKSAFSL